MFESFFLGNDQSNIEQLIWGISRNRDDAQRVVREVEDVVFLISAEPCDSSSQPFEGASDLDRVS